MQQAAAHHGFRVEIITKPEETMCRCTGRLNGEAGAALKAELKGLFPNHRRVVLDLTHVTSMDSSGLGAVVSLYVSAKSAKCEFQLVNLNQRIRELLGLTRLLDAFESCGRHMIKMP